MTVIEMHELATKAAIEAENEFKAVHGEPFYCGFAWVKLMVDGRSALGKEVIKSGIASKSYNGGYDVWNPGKTSTQSMDVKEAGAQAYANVMKTYGIKAYAQSRAD